MSMSSHTVRLSFEQRQRANELIEACSNDDGDTFEALVFELIAMRDLLGELTDAAEDTLRAHPETECCYVTREKCRAARELLTDEQDLSGEQR